jgi:hypothetical protein
LTFDFDFRRLSSFWYITVVTTLNNSMKMENFSRIDFARWLFQQRKKIDQEGSLTAGAIATRPKVLFD